MKETKKLKLCSVFKTKEQEESFAKASEKNRTKGEKLMWDEKEETKEVKLCPVFKTKEQEESFAKASEKNRAKVKKLTWNNN